MFKKITLVKRGHKTFSICISEMFNFYVIQTNLKEQDKTDNFSIKLALKAAHSTQEQLFCIRVLWLLAYYKILSLFDT